MTSWLLERWNQVEHWIRQGIATTPDAVLIAAAVIGAVVVLFVLRRLRVGLAGLWDHLGASFWFVPGLMMAGAVVLSIVMVELDTLVHSRVGGKIVWLWEGGAEAARVMLGTIASSMITIAGVVFSITMVVLSLISGQFGPRLMRNFREDKSNQLVLGTFIATFVYCLMVLRKVTNGPGADFVPYLAIGLSIVLALINVGVIIYFIHHIAVMSQATYIVDLVSEDLARSIDMIFPEEIGEEMAAGHEEPVMDLEEFDRRALSVAAERKGYLQAIEAEKLMALAKDNDLVIHAHYRPGRFYRRSNASGEYSGQKSNRRSPLRKNQKCLSDRKRANAPPGRGIRRPPAG